MVAEDAGTDASTTPTPAARLASWIDLLSEWTGRLIAWFTLAMVLVTFGIVVARYAFNSGSIAIQESVVYLHSLVFMLGAAYALKTGQHVRVDIFYKQMSRRRQAWTDLLGVLLLLLPSCAFVVWVSLDYVGSAWVIKEGSREAGGLPLVWLLKALIPLAAALLLLQGLSMGLRAAITLRRSQ